MKGSVHIICGLRIRDFTVNGVKIPKSERAILVAKVRVEEMYT